MRKLFTSKNLVSHDIVESCPWDFDISEEQVTHMKSLSKETRRATLFQPSFDWQTYSGFCGLIASQRVSDKNSPILCRALVVDYDATSPVEMVHSYIKNLDPSIQPNFLEQSLSNNWRAVWLFEKDILMDGLNFASEYLKTLIETIGAHTMLAGYDEASCKPTQMWTNGGYWLENHDKPLNYGLLAGIASKMIAKRKSEGFDIPIVKIAEEVEKRFPGRWQGDFVEGAHGVRFWDEKADNPRGAFVTKHGCYCFTGLKAYVPWEEIFGKVWVETNRAANFGEVTKNIIFDSTHYWQEQSPGHWVKTSREDTMLLFRTLGLSGKVNKGTTSSDVDRAMRYVQENARVVGACPVLYRPPGVLILNGKRVLNISNIRVVEPAKELSDPGRFPFIWDLLSNLWMRSADRPTDFFFSWLHRAYLGMLNRNPVAGQAIFICGPANNGKTLLVSRIISPLFGNSMADPYDYFSGATQFNSNLMESGLLAINDEQAPYGEKDKDKFLQRIKAFVANVRHTVQYKFKDRIESEWYGRLMVTLNDDPKSISMLPEVNPNTQDKMMFFATQPRKTMWPTNQVIEETIRKELPHFARWLSEYSTPKDIFIGGRFGISSYFDSHLIEVSRQQESSFNLLEIIHTWQKEGMYWMGEGDSLKTEWIGTATELIVQLTEHTSLNVVLRDWTLSRIAKALTALDKLGNMGVKIVGNSNERLFRIEKLII